MEHTLILLTIIVLLAVSSGLTAAETQKPQVLVFHKQKGPSLRAVEKINEVLSGYTEDYQVLYYDIEDAANLELIDSLGLPSTHFPVAVVIDGRFTVQIEGRTASFVHFPDFMKGIGRHEGNWSLSDLAAALQDRSLLLDTNILPVLEEAESEGECE